MPDMSIEVTLKIDICQTGLTTHGSQFGWSLLNQLNSNPYKVSFRLLRLKDIGIAYKLHLLEEMYSYI